MTKNRYRKIASKIFGKTHAHSIALNYPTSADNSPRWGYDRATNQALAGVLESFRINYERELTKLLAFRDEYVETNGLLEDYNGKPILTNPWLPGLDSFCLYAMLAQYRPRLYMEIGSGISTKIARASVNQHDLDTNIVSIDPSPRADIDGICDVVLRIPLEAQDTSIFDQIGANDILFFDGSHRSFMNSDATVFFLEIMPALADGVLVQVHDIFLPSDYPPSWTDRYYNEQYLLAAALLAGHNNFDILLPNAFISRDTALRSLIDPVFDRPDLADVSRYGGSFWLRTK